MRKGEGNDLPGIGWIGKDFLIASHGGVETHFADGVPFRTQPLTWDYRTIGQNQQTCGRAFLPRITARAQGDAHRHPAFHK